MLLFTLLKCSAYFLKIMIIGIVEKNIKLIFREWHQREKKIANLATLFVTEIACDKSFFLTF